MIQIYSHISKTSVSTKYSGNRYFGLVWFCAIVAEMQPHVGMAATGIHERMSTAAFVRIRSILVIKEDEFFGNMHPKHLLTITGESQKIKWRVDRHQYLGVRVAILSVLTGKKQSILFNAISISIIQCSMSVIHTLLYLIANLLYLSVKKNTLTDFRLTV